MKLAIVKTAKPQLTGVRAELVQRVAAHEAAMAALEAAWQPERRLSAVVQEHAVAEAELAACKTEHMAAISVFLEGDGEGPRPSEPPMVLEAARQVEVLRPLAEAAKARLPAVQVAIEQTAARVGAASVELRRAVWQVAVEAAARYARETWLPALNAAVATSAPLQSLRDELWTIGHRGADPDAAAMSCAAQIDSIIATARSAASAPRDPAAGARLLAALASDPQAEL
jgi:hypothetical protein